jgi:hypothetical protein
VRIVAFAHPCSVNTDECLQQGMAKRGDSRLFSYICMQRIPADMIVNSTHSSESNFPDWLSATDFG